MSRSKKIFAAFALIFVLLLAYVVYDISSRTTFPGRSPSENRDNPAASDTVASDSVRTNQP